MVDFRKWFPVLAVIAVMFLSAVPASAQVTGPTIQCIANAGVPPTLRAEGITELVGDLVLNCNGGVPAGRGVIGSPATVPNVNIQIFLNTNVTSRILNTSGNWSEALLMIDEPQPGNQRVCSQVFNPGVSCHNVLPQPGNLTGVNYSGPGSVVPNVFQGQQAGANSIVWLGVPIDAPGTGGTRTIRITNVRANANQLGVSSTLVPSQVFMFISASPSQSLPINNPQQTVGFVLPGLSFALTNLDSPFQQCVSLNTGLLSSTSIGNSDASGNARFREGFATAFKTRNVATTPADPTATADQDRPGQVLNHETGFYNGSEFVGANGPNGVGRAGLADTGTRMIFRVQNINAGVQLFAPTHIVGTGQLILALVPGANANGEGGTPIPITTTPITPATTVAPITLSGGVGGITYEVVRADANIIEEANTNFFFAFRSNTSNNLPALGSGTGNGTLAPISTVTTASATAPIPRFAESPTNPNIITINACSTNLLFTFVANTDGFDTGLVISNTSQDPFGTPTQTGACRINYYGNTTGGGAAPAPVSSAAVPAGGQLIWTLSTGGGVVGGASTAGLATPGFRGYIIAQCAFQYAHGFAFISDLGAQRLAEGYLALVMDESIGSRTGFVSETLGH